MWITRIEKSQVAYIIVLAILVLVVSQNSIACSGYKITLGSKTLFGSNEDAWRVTPRIWFENGKGVGRYGAAFTGSRYDGVNGYAPQSGMNEMGLAFERLASFHPFGGNFSKRKSIVNPTAYLKNILHSCKTVEEVKAYISKYDQSYFIEDVFIYVDKSGKYLIVEPYSLTIGNQSTYVLSNFCPSITPTLKANTLDRYRNGMAYLSKGIDTTLKFCSALSDTMHVCRNKIGDGTLLSSIWDLSNGTVNLYFYHDYKRTVQFNISEELKKGDHLIAIEGLFPKNHEFEKLRDFKTPKNSNVMGVFIVASAGFFLLTSVFFLVQFFKTKENIAYRSIQLMLFPIGIVFSYYMVVLCGKVHVFYFPAPYQDPTNVFVSMTSYLPFVLLLLILPFVVVNFKIVNGSGWSISAKLVFTLNNLIYFVLIGLFAYWKFFNVCS